MNREEIEARASGVLDAFELKTCPIEPLQIAKEEGIRLEPGQYGPKFDGRIEYLRPKRLFVIFYQEAGPGRTVGRVRFSIAHELGHYYLHRVYLRSGQAHSSQADFRSKDPAEQQADEFAAALLMPREQFVREVRRHHRRICTLKEISALAENVFKTSLTSTARRYCEQDLEPCAIMISDAATARVRWAMHSGRMKALGMGYIASEMPLPAPSITARLCTAMRQTAESPEAEGHVEAGVWYDRPDRNDLWEEARTLGHTGLILTFLTVEDQDDADQA